MDFISGGEFKALRLQLGLTQKQAADILNRKVRAIKYWESKDGRVDITLYKMLSDWAYANPKT